MRTKMKPKIELSSMLDKNVKLAGRKDVHLKSWLENCKNLWNVQGDIEDSTENNNVWENCNM